MADVTVVRQPFRILATFGAEKGAGPRRSTRRVSGKVTHNISYVCSFVKEMSFSVILLDQILQIIDK